MQDWVSIYARFLTQRYNQFSFGGGTWAPLKPATIRQKQKKGLLLLILRATDLMFQSFAPEFAGKPGGISEQIPFGVKIKFGGGMSMPHPPSLLTISELAMIHQLGNQRLPARKIIVPPDTECRAQMRHRMETAMEELAAQSAR
jgi:hypothetical protein